MTSCAYCDQRASVDIPSNPGRVCVMHAIEYWTALMAHVKAISNSREHCQMLYNSPDASQSTVNVRSIPNAAARLPAPDTERVSIHRVSQ